MLCVPSDLDTIWKYNCICMIDYKNSNYLIINETSENVFWLCWSASWFVPSDLYIWRYRWVHHQWKLMIEVATTLWLRSIGCNIFTLDAIKLDRDIFKLSASLKMLWNHKCYETSSDWTMCMGHWTKFDKSQVFQNGIWEVPMVGLIHLNFGRKKGIWQIPIRLNALMTCTKKYLQI